LKLEGDYNIAYNVKNIGSPYVNPPYPGAHNLLQNPMLTAPFSGEAHGMMPVAGSPAIDAGNNANCPAVDWRGYSRPIDGDEDGESICDLGAYELLPPAARVYLPIVGK
jgi:hypothetical protein